MLAPRSNRKRLRVHMHPIHTVYQCVMSYCYCCRCCHARTAAAADTTANTKAASSLLTRCRRSSKRFHNSIQPMFIYMRLVVGQCRDMRKTNTQQSVLSKYRISIVHSHSPKLPGSRGRDGRESDQALGASFTRTLGASRYDSSENVSRAEGSARRWLRLAPRKAFVPRPGRPDPASG